MNSRTHILNYSHSFKLFYSMQIVERIDTYQSSLVVKLILNWKMNKNFQYTPNMVLF